MRAMLLALGGLAACGGSHKPASEEPKVSPKLETRKVIEEDPEDNGPAQVTLTSDRGHMDVKDIEAGLAPHTTAMTDCYMTRVGKRRWLGGSVELHWDISRDGEITAVKMATSDLGAWPVEKCILEIARQATFAKPTGGDADFALPLSFSAKGAAMPWDETQSLRAVGGQTSAFAACDKALQKREADFAKKKQPAPKKGEKIKPHVAAVPPEDVTVTLYVGPHGAAQSVGLSSKASVIDADWGDCAEKAALAWRLPDPKGSMAKLVVKYKPGSGSED